MLRSKLALRLTPAVWVILAPFLLFFLPLITGKALYWGLPYLQFIPWRHYAWMQLRQGIMPLWNPLNGMGAPLMANYQLALFYPPALPLFLLDEIFGAAGLAWGFTMMIPLHLAWGGLGMVWLMKQLGIRQRGQIVSGLAFGLSGYLVARGSFFSIVWAAVWLPWLINGIESLLNAKSWQMCLQAGLKTAVYLTMMLLAGHAQVAWYAILFSGVWAVVRGWQVGRWKKSLISGALLVACVVAAAGLAAVQLLPTFEYLVQSQRAAAYDFETAMVYSFSPFRLAGYLIPDLLGNPGYGDFLGYATYWEDAVYIGLIPFILALTTLGFLWKKKNHLNQGLVAMLWLMSIVGVILSLGSNTPIFPWLFQHVPTFGQFQAPARWMIWPTAALAILAGLGADAWSVPGKKATVFLNLAVFGGLVVAVLAGAAAVFLPNTRSGLVRGLVIFGVVTAGSSFLARRLPVGRPGGWGVAAGIWLVLDLFVANAALNPTISAQIYNTAYSQLEQINKTARGGRIWIDPKLDYQIKYQDLFTFSDFQSGRDWSVLRSYLVDDANLLDGVGLINNFDPLLSGRYSRWVNGLPGLNSELKNKWLALANTSLELTQDSSISTQTTLRTVIPEPRLSWTSCAIPAGTPEQAYSLVESRFSQNDSQGCVIIEGDLPFQSAAVNSGHATIVSEQPDTVLASVESSTDGWLILRDTWFPGWIANIDGVKTEILRADYLFRAVRVPAGKHMIEFVYNPDSFTKGLWLSIGTWILVGIGWWFLRKTDNG